jgi:uncharacterized protein YdiU (UPF0061 family)
MKLSWETSNTYRSLPSELYKTVQADVIDKPNLVVFNHRLADELGIDVSTLSNEELAKVFSGNQLDESWTPIAQAYAGHQYGGFSLLGDGRAMLLTELMTRNGTRVDLQLKGSGKTPYSRGGDGKAALGPMLREYLISEAMHALGIPSTRSLAVVKTNEPIIREVPLPGAILTRVAESHIRVGTFQWIAQKGDPLLQKQFVEYVIDRHFPELKESERPARSLLQEVIRRQATLIAKWQSVGFVHGVMNTDNMLISGETIDYGPCAFLDQYHPQTVYSSIDHHGRYSYQNQPNAALWNLTRFAETLLSLLDRNPDVAVQIAQEELAVFAPTYVSEYYRLFGLKIGLSAIQLEDHPLIDRLLELMQSHGADFTNTFASLTNQQYPANPLFESLEFIEWNSLWLERISKEKHPYEVMKNINPQVIPRNQLVDQALTAAQANDDSLFQELLAAIQNPFTVPVHSMLTTPGPANEKFITYCGT